MSIKAYRYRFYPTREQEKILAHTFGCVRYVWNRALAYRQATYVYTGKGANYGETSKAMTGWRAQHDWLSRAASVPLQQALRQLNAAYTNFFKALAKFPRFKSKRDSQGLTYTRSGFRWDADSQTLTVAKLGALKIRWSRRFTADPSTVTITKNRAGQYHVSIRIDEPNRELPAADGEVGIDLGITTHATLSTGEKVDNQRFTKRFASKLRRAQKSLSRKKKGSNRWQRAKLKVARIQQHNADSRRDWMHKTTTRLVSENQTLVVEDLNIQGMLKNRRLAKHVADCAWFEFVRQLEYKCEWYGREFVQIDRWEPTSKTCSNCGHVVELTLSDRTWACDSCGEHHDRDVNAAKNILAAGHAVKAQGETVRRPSRKSRRTVNQPKASLGIPRL